MWTFGAWNVQGPLEVGEERPKDGLVQVVIERGVLPQVAMVTGGVARDVLKAATALFRAFTGLCRPGRASAPVNPV